MPDEGYDEPRLRIETGAHNGRVLGCDVDGAASLLLTAGDDKTARLWSLPELRPLAVLRPPFGDAANGNLAAAALSQDGAMGAIAGYTGGPMAIHVFDVARCEIVRTVELPQHDWVGVMRFSPDRSLLALGTVLNGLIVVSVRDWRQIGQDASFGDRLIALEFSGDGAWLGAAGQDGGVRLYASASLESETIDPALRVDAAAGRRAACLRFAPDGATLAVGFEDGGFELRQTSTLDLLLERQAEHLTEDAKPLLPRTAPDFSSVAWCAGGAALLASGFVCVTETGCGVLRVEATAPARSPAEWAHAVREPLGANVGYMAAIASGFVVVTRIGEIAVYGEDGARRAHVVPPQGDLRAVYDADNPAAGTFRVSLDGSVAEWSVAPDWQIMRFDARELKLDAANLGLAPWTDRSGKLRVKGWQGDEPLQIVAADGREIALPSGLEPFAVDVDQGHVLLGTGFNLYRFRVSDGAETACRPLGQAARRVNQSQDGRLAVAALLDGTIRWFSLPDLRELLALFVTSEPSPRWVAFTPGGYYAAGAGAESLIGWHLDRGPERSAAFVPASKYAERFHRPDVVRRVLRTLDETAALREADAALGEARTPSPEQQRAALRADQPPMITILVPREDALLPADGDVVIAAEVRVPEAQRVEEVFVRVDSGRVSAKPLGEPIHLASPAPGETATLRLLRVELGPEPRPKAVLEVFALDEDKRMSESAVVTLRRPPALSAPSGQATKPRLLAVLAGMSAYRIPELRTGVRFAADDAKALGRRLERQQGLLYREVQCRCLPEADLTRDALLDALDWLEAESTGLDTALLFLSGHGVTWRRGMYYYLTRDATLDAPDREGLSGTELVSRMQSIGAKRIVLLDTCYAGAAGQPPPPWAPDTERLMNDLHSASVPVFGATVSNRRAVERADLGHGVFTHALLKLLDRPSRPLAYSELWAGLRREVGDLTAGGQEPCFLNAGNGADLALLAGAA
jgi:hypothetical protein